MTNLLHLSSQPRFTYDWNQIEDTNSRSAVKSAVETYRTIFNNLRSKAQQIITDDNLAKARCVYTLKLSLKHGQFLDVCQQALGLNHTTASALASTGQLLMQGDHTPQLLDMIKVMEPRAANKLLKSDNETKLHTRVHFENTGKVPTLRDLKPKKPKMFYDSEVTPIAIAPTESVDDVRDRLAQAKIRPVHFVQWMTQEIKQRSTVKPDLKQAIDELMVAYQALE